jgi:hypothetical protein
MVWLGGELKSKLDQHDEARREKATHEAQLAEDNAEAASQAATRIQCAQRGKTGRRKAKARRILPRKAPAVAVDSPALLRVSQRFGPTEVHNLKRAPAEITCVITKKGALGLVWKPRTVPAPPPASPCCLAAIEKGSGGQAKPSLQVGMWLTHVQDQPVVDFFTAVNRINKAKRPLRLGFQRLPQNSDHPPLDEDTADGSNGDGTGQQSDDRDVYRLSAAEVQTLGRHNAGVELALHPLPYQPSRAVIFQAEADASALARRRVALEGFAVAGARRLELRSGDSFKIETPTGQVIENIAPLLVANRVDGG